MERVSTLILTRSDLVELMNLSDYRDAVENAFSSLASGRVTGAGILDIPGQDGMFHVKGCGMQMGEDLYVAVKVNGNFPDNQKRYGLPTIQGAILLCDGIHGNPLALLDSAEITMQRTAAASVIAALHLARKNPKTITICGCGLQGRIHLLSLKEIFPLSRAFAFDQNQELAKAFCDRMQQETGIPVVPLSHLAEGTRQSDVIVTCTTSRKYILKNEDVSPGAFVAAIGADSHDKQEIDPSLLASSKVVADILDQCVRIGDLHHAIEERRMTRDDVYAELHEITSGAKRGRTSEKEIIVFDSTGTAIQDVAAAAVAYQRALQRGIGRFVDLFGAGGTA
jgi:ornithine cyclodeaminase/alanine dehydrogenase-like protein (mu-crystallin family)